MVCIASSLGPEQEGVSPTVSVHGTVRMSVNCICASAGPGIKQNGNTVQLARPAAKNHQSLLMKFGSGAL